MHTHFLDWGTEATVSLYKKRGERSIIKEIRNVASNFWLIMTIEHGVKWLPGCKFLQEFRLRSLSCGQFKYKACMLIQKRKFQILEAWEKTCSTNLFSQIKLTSKPEHPHKLSFFKQLCLIISFWFVRCRLVANVFCNLRLLSSAVGWWELGSHMVMPQSISSRCGNWAVANWMPPEMWETID